MIRTTTRARLLCQAIIDGNTKLIRELLTSGEEGNLPDEPSQYSLILHGRLHGLSPLHYAALKGQAEAVRLLVEFGADLNAEVEVHPCKSMDPHPQLKSLNEFAWEAVNDPDSVSYTLNAIHYAAWAGAVEALAVMVEERPGDFVNSRIRQTLQTPLHIIALGGNMPLFCGACSRHRKPCPFAPVPRSRKRQADLQADKGFADAIEDMKQGGIRATGHGLCIQYTVQRTAQILLKAGAEAHLKDWKGKCAMQSALAGGQYDSYLTLMREVALHPETASKLDYCGILRYICNLEASDFAADERLTCMGGRQYLKVLLNQVVATCGSSEQLIERIKHKASSVLRHAVTCDARCCFLWLMDQLKMTETSSIFFFNIGRLPSWSFLGTEKDSSEMINAVHYAAYVGAFDVLLSCLRLYGNLPDGWKVLELRTASGRSLWHLLAEGQNAAEGLYQRNLDSVCQHLLQVSETEHLAATRDGWTPFLIAARCCNNIFINCYMRAWLSERIGSGIACTAPWKAALPDGRTALMLALQGGGQRTAWKCLQADEEGWDLIRLDSKGCHCLFYCVQNISLTRMVCEHAWAILPGGKDSKAGLSTRPEWGYLGWLNHRPNACLPLAHLAVMHNSLFLLGLMRKRGADLTVCDEHGLTPLFRACKEQKDAAVKFLASIADKDTMEARDSEHGITALGHAAAWGYSVAVDLLLSNCKRLDVEVTPLLHRHADESVHHTPIFSAIFHSYPGIMDALLDAGLKMNAVEHIQVDTRRVVRDKREDTDALDILLAAACVGNDVLVKKALAADVPPWSVTTPYPDNKRWMSAVTMAMDEPAILDGHVTRPCSPAPGCEPATISERTSAAPATTTTGSTDTNQDEWFLECMLSDGGQRVRCIIALLQAGAGLSPQQLQKLSRIKDTDSEDAEELQALLKTKVKDCGQCGMFGRWKKCKGCRKVYYCSVNCQHSAWRAHRQDCVQS